MKIHDVVFYDNQALLETQREDIIDITNFQILQPTTKKILSLAFTSCGQMVNRNEQFNNLFYLQIKSIDDNVSNQQSEYQPQYYVGQTLTFTDKLTKRQNHIVTSSSLPDIYHYYIPNYRSQKPLLCLDLDETLIFARSQQPSSQSFQIKVDNTVFHVVKRPKLSEFLLAIAQLFELAIFTHSQQDYADQIINEIDSHHLISYRFYRQHCAKIGDKDGAWAIKDLSRVGVPLDRIALVDDIEKVAKWQPFNLVKLKVFQAEVDDNELNTQESAETRWELLTLYQKLKVLASVPSIYQKLLYQAENGRM